MNLEKKKKEASKKTTKMQLEYLGFVQVFEETVRKC